MKGFIEVLFLSFGLQLISAQSMMGPYYVRNRGYFPTSVLNNTAINYRTSLTAAPDYLITGDYWIMRKIGPLGLIITADMSSHGNFIGNQADSGQKLIFKNVCKMDGFSFEPFKERFSGKFDDECYLQPGNYTLKDWSIEYHMRPNVTNMLYGDYLFHLCWIEGGQKPCILQCDIKILFDDIKRKPGQEKAGRRGGAKKKGFFN